MYGAHPSFDSPLKYQLLPLSARMSPCFFMAVRMTSDGPLNLERSKLFFSRRRRPIGGVDASLPPAACVAGWM